MAQTGYTPILLYSSSTSSQVPAAGNLTNSTLGSELAINITDGKLFYKDNANAIQVIGWKTVPTSAGGTGLTSYTAGDLLYYVTGTTLTKLGIGAANTVLTSSGSAPQWSTNLNIGSLTATSISDSGNLTFTGTGNRIVGDTSNGTVANRLALQDSTTNSQTIFSVFPNGTGTTSQLQLYNTSNTTNYGRFNVIITSGALTLSQTIVGTATYLPMTFAVGGAEALRIETNQDVKVNSGNLVIGTSGKGIDFSANPNAPGMTSELLDDYEIGTWTPTVSAPSGSFTTVTTSGTYTKVGNLVRASFDIVINNIGTATAMNFIGALPFTSNSGAFSSGAVRESVNTGVAWTLTVGSSTTSINTFNYANSQTVANGATFKGSIVYYV